MENQFENIVYSKNVIEFVTVANELTLFIENSEKSNLFDFIKKLQKFLPLLYLKSSLLPECDAVDEERIEKYVTETHYYKILSVLQTKFGENDNYKDVFDTLMNETDEVNHLNLSEDLTDIYQDLKDFLINYRIGNIEIMNNALWECKNNFEIYWGHRLLSVLKILHLKLYKFTEHIKEKDQV